MMDRLPLDDQYIFPKKYARILWKLNKNQEIDELKVYEILSAERAQCLSQNCKPIKCLIFSSGNCYSDWDKWSLEDILLDIFKYMIADKEVLKEIFVQLGKIKEFSLRLSCFNDDYWDVQKEEGG